MQHFSITPDEVLHSSMFKIFLVYFVYQICSFGFLVGYTSKCNTDFHALDQIALVSAPLHTR